MDCFATRAQKPTPLFPVSKSTLNGWLKKQPARVKNWVKTFDYKASAGSVLRVPNASGKLDRVLVGVSDRPNLFALAHLPAHLPKGSYALQPGALEVDEESLCVGWALACYRFDKYKAKTQAKGRKLMWPTDVDKKRVERLALATYLVRDLITTPANDMGPDDLEAAARAVAKDAGAKIRVVKGDALLKENYPTIHAVGRAAEQAPRLLDITWGKADAPKVTLVGKGVCFDSGGLDLKSAAGMKLMKKDMGGAAMALGLAQAIMDAKLDLRLRVLIGAVENAVSSNAFRPLDVIKTRKGLTVEVGNTDAEGRLVMCDCLADADTEDPEMILDFSTLTGAARIALGAEVPALFCNDEALAEDFLDAASAEQDLVWRLPLHRPYARHLKSSVADLNNVSSVSYGGAITAALYLSRFVSEGTSWAHMDLMGYNLDSRPGRPAGGEAMGLRAAYAMLERRFSKD